MKWLSAPWRKDDSKKRDGSTSTDASTKARPRIPPDFPDTVRRLNHLVDRLGVTRYLEIGLGNGGTFDGVEAPHKVGVDPHPWNRDLHDIGGVHILTSDEYFRLHWDDGQRFDLILLDGLHTAEQTYRDFVNSLHFAHANTVWLIDDVMPNDAFSAIPDQAESIRQRKATGSDNTAWHGDVYKVVWMIRTFHRGAAAHVLEAAAAIARLLPECSRRDAGPRHDVRGDRAAHVRGHTDSPGGIRHRRRMRHPR